MKYLPLLETAFFVLLLVPAGNADQASAAYKHGARAEGQNHYDEAYQAYRDAHSLKPKDPKYLAAYTRIRFYAAVEHLRAGQQLRTAGKLQEALAEFQHAAEIDRSNFVAQEEARRTADMIRKEARKEEPAPAVQSPLAKQAEQAGGPVELEPTSNALINLRLNENANLVYKIIGKLAGINVVFDPDYKPQKISIELNDVTLREAFDLVALQSKTFWQPTSTNTILVAADTPGKRKDMQDTVMKTFYLHNLSTASELQEAAGTLKAILDVSRVQLIPAQNAMIIRGTQDQMVLAEKVLSDIDKPKPEVVIDIAVLQVSRSRVRTLGSTPPTSVSVALQPSSSSSGGSGSGGGFTFNSLANINATNFSVAFGGDTFTALMSDSNTKVIQNPELRVLDNEKATLKIGDRVPVATGSFGAAGGTQGFGALVNTQFQYLDVGVNIDITPHIHSEREVTLKMTLEVSSVTGNQNIGGISQPIIGQRRIEHETRLQDGDVNLVGGILEDTEIQSLSGYPWLTKVPILKYLFGQEDKERQENEIVFAITPHIVRAQNVTDENLRMVDLGAGSSVIVRHKDPRKEAPPAAPAATTPTAAPSSSQRGRPGAIEQHPAAGVPAATAPTQPNKVPPTSNGSSPPQPPQNSATQPNPRAAPPSVSKVGSDSCPYGQHAIGEENGRIACAFD
jgi:general secretion pathway protein D